MQSAVAARYKEMVQETERKVLSEVLQEPDASWRVVPAPENNALGITMYRRVKPDALPFGIFEYRLEAQSDCPSSHLASSLIDLNWQRMWDAGLETSAEERVDATTCIRSMSYENRYGPQMVLFRTITHWTIRPDVASVVYAMLPSKDPSPLDLLDSGLVVVPRIGGSYVTLYAVLRPNNVDYRAGLLESDGGCYQWFCGFMMSTKTSTSNAAVVPSSTMPLQSAPVALMVPVYNTVPASPTTAPAPAPVPAPAPEPLLPVVAPSDARTQSFSFPNQGSLTPSVDLSNNLPRLPSFSNLGNDLYSTISTPVVVAGRPLDVTLPLGVSIADYWPVAFNFSQTPIVVINPKSLDRVEYCSPSFALLTGGNKNVRLHEGDLRMVQWLCNELATTNGRQFFLHAFAFVGEKCVVIGEGNAASCMTAEGLFVVIQLKPIVARRQDAVSELSAVPEISSFAGFFLNSPQSAALLLPSGFVMAANKAFIKEYRVSTDKPILGMHISALCPSLDWAPACAALWEHFFQPERPSHRTICDRVSISCVAFRRGNNQFHDYLRGYLFTSSGGAAADEDAAVATAGVSSPKRARHDSTTQ